MAHRDKGVPEDVEQNLGGHDPHIVAFKLALPAHNVPEVCTDVPTVLGHPQGCVSSQHVGLLQQGKAEVEQASLRCSWRPDHIALNCDTCQASLLKAHGVAAAAAAGDLWAVIILELMFGVAAVQRHGSSWQARRPRSCRETDASVC